MQVVQLRAEGVKGNEVFLLLISVNSQHKFTVLHHRRSRITSFRTTYSISIQDFLILLTYMGVEKNKSRRELLNIISKGRSITRCVCESSDISVHLLGSRPELKLALHVPPRSHSWKNSADSLKTCVNLLVCYT